ncbi:DUF2750 domain-containing protein [Pseudomonas sp. CGJS7]|uniref:DUF2750 domain-containing protein n=1 Tax=Pseudomonas sp. CGJS7 TaxID=3109348 RepID=UPI0030096D37
MNPQDYEAEQRLMEYAELSGAERYAAFLESVARTGRFWVAVAGEFVLTLFDEDGQELLPAWPSAATARAALARAPQLHEYAPAPRELAQWREHAATAMSQAKVGVGVFPNAQMQSAVVETSQLLAHLDEVLAEDGSLDGEDTDGDEAEGLDLERAQRELMRKFAKPKD